MINHDCYSAEKMDTCLEWGCFHMMIITRKSLNNYRMFDLEIMLFNSKILIEKIIFIHFHGNCV